MNRFLTNTLTDLVEAVKKLVPMTDDEAEDVAALMIRVQFLHGFELRPNIQRYRIERLLTIIRLENKISGNKSISISPPSNNQ
ncbi:hypothetical protein [Nodularia chucula]|uniref:hypothetical protein n=1 Tax=Nodularia chucula TaxID=3093667 RepID=UPI0039C6107E